MTTPLKISAQAPQFPCPHCGSTILWSEDRGAHCDGCDDFDPDTDLPAPTAAPSSEEARELAGVAAENHVVEATKKVGSVSGDMGKCAPVPTQAQGTPHTNAFIAILEQANEALEREVSELLATNAELVTDGNAITLASNLAKKSIEFAALQSAHAATLAQLEQAKQATVDATKHLRGELDIVYAQLAEAQAELQQCRNLSWFGKYHKVAAQLEGAETKIDALIRNGLERQDALERQLAGLAASRDIAIADAKRCFERAQGLEGDKARLDFISDMDAMPEWDDNGFWKIRYAGQNYTGNTVRYCIDAAMSPAAGTEDAK